MHINFRHQKFGFIAFFAALLMAVSACGTAENGSEVFIKANPPVDGEMDYSPRTVRVFLTELPDIDKSSLRLTGADGEVPLTRFHTMGANDLMAEIDRYPLPNGTYTVHWTAQFVNGEKTYSGSYQFTVAAPQ
jgi:methionine-rich copper-binding protein CopC